MILPARDRDLYTPRPDFAWRYRTAPSSLWDFGKCTEKVTLESWFSEGVYSLERR